jgi:glycosyltransferase involved in cell wall biosynthesis
VPPDLRDRRLPERSNDGPILVSIIIPVYNDPRLATCLECLKGQTLGSDRFEVLVIDNGSDAPPSELVARYPFARLDTESTPGSYAARNRGLELATGSVMAFTDSDCVPSAEWLATGLAAIESEEGVVAVGGRVDVFPHDAQRPTAVELFDIAFAFDQERTLRERGFAVTANLFVPRAAFERVGLFNEELLSGSDGEWCHRAAELGIPTRYCADAAVAHPARSRLAQIIRKRRRVVGGRVRRNRGRTPWTLEFWKTATRRLLPDFERLARGRRRLIDRGHGPWAWLKLVWIMLLVDCVGLMEYVRLRLGGSAERR